VPGYSGAPYGADQGPPPESGRAGGNSFNPMKMMPNPMKVFGGNKDQ
jgi:hypothetical protein